MRDEYVPRDHNVICDECGFKKKRSQCRMTWDNLLVCSDTCWQPRHPQDFVRGKTDKQRVAISRPESQTMLRTTTLASGAAKLATSVVVASISNINQYDGIGIALDADFTATGDNIHWTYVSSISGTTVTLGEVLPSAAASGNTVYGTFGTRFVTTDEVTATQL